MSQAVEEWFRMTSLTQETVPMVRLLLVFLHVTSAMGIVAGLGIEGWALVQFRAARTLSDARVALGSTRYVQRFMGLSMLTAIVTGMYLATAYWRWQGAWMGMALLTIVVMAIVGGFMTGRPTTRVLRSVGDGLGAEEIATVQRSLGLSYVVRLGLFLGIVFLMTTKPASGVTALLVIVTAAAIGVLGGLPARRVRDTVRA
jgi:hypothetical protein